MKDTKKLLKVKLKVNVKKGNKVKLRNGKIVSVSEVAINPDLSAPYPITIYFKDYFSRAYTKSGSEFLDRESDWDIMEISE